VRLRLYAAVRELSDRLLVLASIGNFLLFFARDIIVTLKYGRRQLAKKTSQFARRDDGPFHSCTVCGITDKTHPQMDFRYCTSARGSAATAVNISIIMNM